MIWLKTALFSAGFVAAMFVLVPMWILGASGGPPQVADAARILAFLLLGLGFALMVWCWGSFTLHGRGTPSPFDPPRQLVIRGPYRYVRNPMYIAGVLVIVGEAVLFASLALLVYAAVFWLGAHLLVLMYEERALTRSFDGSYDTYRATVSRWMPHRAPAAESPFQR